MILNAKLVVILLIILLLLLFVFISPISAQTESLQKSLKPGEALIWYLYHSGWAVKTQNNFLIFDYVEDGSKPKNATLQNGWIDPQNLKDEKVYVFISHAHGDHFDPDILRWGKAPGDITYIFGWETQEYSRYITLDQPHAKLELDGMEIFAIHHDFDNIPEAAFLVKVDGLVIYHSGDHGSTGGVINPVFKDNIDYLAKKTKKVDIAFISQFGSRSGEAVNQGDLYTMNTFKPTITFPMHRGGGEDSYKDFAREAQQNNVPTQVKCATTRGDRFFYGNGVVADAVKGEYDE